MNHLRTAAAIIIRDRKLLGVREVNKTHFLAPGGQIEPGETATQTLVRELQEELCLAIPEKDLEPYGTFTSDAVNHPGHQVHMEAFLVKNLHEEPKPSNEIAEICWLRSTSSPHIRVGHIFRLQIIPTLKTKNLID
jgi:8-oxo-dGTP diphosphatase